MTAKTDDDMVGEMLYGEHPDVEDTSTEADAEDRAPKRPRPWFAVANDIQHDPKLSRLPYEARWAFLCAVGWCNAWRTDGLIREEALRGLFGEFPNGDRWPHAYVEVGLWERVTGVGYRIINYLKWQRSLKQIESQLDDGRARSHRKRDKEKAKKQADKQRGAKAAATKRARGVARDVGVHVPSTVPSRSDDVPIFDLTARIQRERAADA